MLEMVSATMAVVMMMTWMTFSHFEGIPTAWELTKKMSAGSHDEQTMRITLVQVNVLWRKGYLMTTNLEEVYRELREEQCRS